MSNKTPSNNISVTEIPVLNHENDDHNLCTSKRDSSIIEIQENKVIKNKDSNVDTKGNNNKQSPTKSPNLSESKKNSKQKKYVEVRQSIDYNGNEQNQIEYNEVLTNQDENNNQNILMNNATLDDEDFAKEGTTKNNKIGIRLNLIEGGDDLVTCANKDENNIENTENVVNFEKVVNHKAVSNLTTTGELITKQVTESIVCKICYEGDSEDKPISRPCKCQGSMQYIHLECLKKWFGDKDVTVEKPFCEICKYEYKLKYDYEYLYSQKKTFAMMKNMLLVVVVSIVVLVLIDVLIMVVLGSVTAYTEPEKDNILHVLIGISCGIIVIILLTYFRDFRENYYDKKIINWKVKDFEIGDDLIKDDPEEPKQQFGHSFGSDGSVSESSDARAAEAERIGGENINRIEDNSNS